MLRDFVSFGNYGCNTACVDTVGSSIGGGPLVCSNCSAFLGVRDGFGCLRTPSLRNAQRAYTPVRLVKKKAFR